MRYMDPVLRERLKKARQTLYENAQPGAVIWLSRPVTPLTDSFFLERALIGTYPGLSAVSVALRHMSRDREPDRIYAAYIADGVLRVLWTQTQAAMSSQLWVTTDTSIPATDAALCFDGVTEKTPRRNIEFITGELPWLFWVDGGALYGSILVSAGEPVTLALENVTSVAAVRGMWSEIPYFDMGLLVFFTVGGIIYQRAYKAGVWEDAAPVSFGPDKTWVKLAVSRTWDYRIVVQALADDGTLWELVTQTFGVAARNMERIALEEVEAEGSRTEITYRDTNGNENIAVTDTAVSGGMIYALSSMPVSAANIDDGAGNWGKYICVVLDYPVTAAAGNGGSFILTDSAENTYIGQTAFSSDGKTLTVGFIDFNAADNYPCMLSYTPGTIQSPVVAMETWMIEFTPENLIPPMQEPPAPTEVWNE